MLPGIFPNSFDIYFFYLYEGTQFKAKNVKAFEA